MRKKRTRRKITTRKAEAKDSKSRKNQIFFREHFFAINVCIVDVKKYKNKEKKRK
jgi:hypothetical protein